MTSGDAELNVKFNQIQLMIQIEVKIGEKKEKRTTFESENL